MKKLEELRKRIDEARDRIAAVKALKESKKSKADLTEAESTFGLAALMESELDKAELILAIKVISDELQRMAEKVAKIEAEEIMPLLDSLKSAFGPEISDSFNTNATESVRTLVEAIKSTKEVIGNEVLRMEAVADGRDSSDAALGIEGTDDFAASDLGQEMGEPDDMGMGDMEMEPEMGDDEMALDIPDEDFSDEAPVEDIEDDFEDAYEPAAGRAKK